MRRVISWKRFAIVVAVLLTAIGATFGVHALQSRRNADGLRKQAEHLLADKSADPAKMDEAIKALDTYLKLRPKDEEAFRKYAQVSLDRAKADPSKGRDATEAVEKFLRQFPEHPEERRRLISLYMDQVALMNARQHIRILFDRGGEFKDDVDLLDQAATCEVGLSGDIAQAVKYLDEAIQTKKAPPRVVERLLGLLHGAKAYNDPRYTPAKYLEILVNQDPYRTDVEARVLAGQFLLKTGESQNARKHINDALAMPGGASNPEVLMAAAALERSEIKSAETVMPQLKKSRVHLETAFAIDKKNIRVGLLLAETLTDLNEFKAAIDVLRTAAGSLGESNDDLTMRLIDKLIDLRELELSSQLIARVEKNEADKSRFGKYFRGRIAVLNSDWATARKLLEEVSPVMVRVPYFHKKSEWGLGQCYSVIQNPDKQLEHNAAALKDDPFYISGHIGIADAYLKLGKYREALAEFRTIVLGFGLNAHRPAYARLEYRAAIMSPLAGRNWDAFENSLGKEEDRVPELHVLYAESLIVRGNLEKASEILRAVLKKDPKNALAWLTLARIASRSSGGGPDAARKLLEEAAKSLGDSVDLRLARAQVLVSRTRKPTVLDFKALSGNLDTFEKTERRRLLLGLGETASRAALIVEEPNGVPLRDLAIEYMRGAAELESNDLISRAVLVDLGMQAKRNDVVDQALAEIAKAEGEKGPIGTLARVIRRVPEVRKIDDKMARAAAIAELRAMALRARADRPGWNRVYVVLAQLDEMEGLNDSALTNYKEAIDKGERQEHVIRRAVDLYRDKRQDDQAALLLNSLHTEMNLPDDLERFRAIRDLLARDIPSTERPTIDKIAPDDSKEWRILLLRGSLLSAIGADADALLAFRKAVEQGDYVPETWGALVTHLVRAEKLDDARRATDQVEKKIDVKDAVFAAKTPDQKADLIIVLAMCREMIGDLKQAEERYRSAVEVAPRELNGNRELIRFLKRTNRNDEGDARLKRLAEAPEQDLARWARRYLALALLADRRSSYPNRTAALQLLERNLAVKPIDQDDVKAKAVVQTVDPLTREEGMKTLRDFAKWGDLTADEFLLLASLHFEQGKVFESVDYFEQAARPRDGLGVKHLVNLIRIYEGLPNLPKARSALARLKQFAGRSWDALAEEARLLHLESVEAEKRGATDEAAKLNAQALNLILGSPKALTEDAIRRRTGPLLEELGFSREAETQYTRLLTEGKEPNPHFPLALLLIRQKRTQDAIDLAKKYEPKSPAVLTASIYTSAIRMKSPGTAAEREIAAWLDTKLKNPQNTYESLSLLSAKAQFSEGIGRYEEAIDGYESALRLAKAARPEEVSEFDPQLIANNLAMLMALYRPAEADRAIKLMNEVIDIRGPAPVFLDTRAVCYLIKGGKIEEATNDLKLALIQQQKAVYLFHLAWAYDLNPDKRALREQTLEEAKKLGITPDDLHPMEARKFNELYRSK